MNVKNLEVINNKNTEYCKEIIKYELQMIEKHFEKSTENYEVRKNIIRESDFKMFRTIFTNDMIYELISKKSLKNSIYNIENIRKLCLEYTYELLNDFSGNDSNKELKKFFKEEHINGNEDAGRERLIYLRTEFLKKHAKIDIESIDLQTCIKYSDKNINIDLFQKNIVNVNKYIDEISGDDIKTQKEFKDIINKILELIKNNNCMINSIFRIIFNYDKYCVSYRHEIVSLLDIRSCPYCNRQYVTNYQEKMTTADLDHFYAQSIYPYLSLSLYNFIPSCQICNSRFKKKLDFYKTPHIYPYEQEFGDKAIFKTNFSKNKQTKYNISYLLGDSNEFEIDILTLNKDCELKRELENSIETFRLKDVYQSHKDYVKEIISKIHVYNRIGIKELMGIEGLFESEEEVKSVIFGQYLNSNDLNKRPLSKLTKDICNEFDVEAIGK